MKTFLSCCISMLVLLPASLLAQKQAERFHEVRTVYGDKLYEAVFHLPETKDTIRKHIPNLHQWVAFETNFWKQVPEETKVKILDELGAQADALKDGGDITRLWRRINEWIAIDAQLNLLSDFSEADEGFYDILFDDPLMRPAFKGALERRRKDFDPRLLGASLASGERAGLQPILVEKLLDAPRAERFACFARLFSRLEKDASQGTPSEATPKPKRTGD